MLSYVHWCLGDVEQAITLGEYALRENRALGFSRHSEAAVLAGLDFYQESVGAWAAAAENLAEARAGFLGLGTYSDSLIAQSVEARCMLALERYEEARKLAGEVWGYIREHGSAGIFFPGRVYVAIADVATPLITNMQVSPCD